MPPEKMERIRDGGRRKNGAARKRYSSALGNDGQLAKKRQLAEAAASKAAKGFKKVRDLRAAARAGKAAAKRRFKEDYEYDMLRFPAGERRPAFIRKKRRIREIDEEEELWEVINRGGKICSRKCSQGEEGEIYYR